MQRAIPYSGFSVLAAALFVSASLYAQEELPPGPSEESGPAFEFGPGEEWSLDPDAGDPLVDYGDQIDYCSDVEFGGHWFPYRHQIWQSLRFRHSSTHGRASGSGQPLTGTSWLNRPYEFGLDTGAFVMTERISASSAKNNDLLAAAHLGWDWDHYWGTQLRIAWTTPELSSSTGTGQSSTNDILIYDVSMMYYPWGDSRVRPYYRFGFGLTDLDFINPAGVQENATLFTVPVGVGIKYQTKRWMAFRAEATDYITYGQNSASGVQNLAFTLGLEWRFGGRPSGTWSSPAQRRTW